MILVHFCLRLLLLLPPVFCPRSRHKPLSGAPRTNEFIIARSARARHECAHVQSAAALLLLLLVLPLPCGCSERIISFPLTIIIWHRICIGEGGRLCRFFLYDCGGGGNRSFQMSAMRCKRVCVIEKMCPDPVPIQLEDFDEMRDRFARACAKGRELVRPLHALCASTIHLQQLCERGERGVLYRHKCG